MNVFSYSKSCGFFNDLDARLPTTCANSIVASNAGCPTIFSPVSIFSKLKVKNTESVSPYT